MLDIRRGIKSKSAQEFLRRTQPRACRRCVKPTLSVSVWWARWAGAFYRHFPEYTESFLAFPLLPNPWRVKDCWSMRWVATAWQRHFFPLPLSPSFFIRRQSAKTEKLSLPPWKLLNGWFFQKQQCISDLAVSPGGICSIKPYMDPISRKGNKLVQIHWKDKYAVQINK